MGINPNSGWGQPAYTATGHAPVGWLPFAGILVGRVPSRGVGRLSGLKELESVVTANLQRVTRLRQPPESIQ